MYLFIDYTQCRGCRTCEMACSYRWSKSFTPTQSSIIVIKNEPEGKNFPVVCQQCSKPLCVEVCLNNALIRDEKQGIVLHEPKKCLGCKMCIISCPFGGIGYIGELGIARKCDLCISYDTEPGVAQCEKWCPYQVIKVIKDEKISTEMKKILSERIEKLGIYGLLVK